MPTFYSPSHWAAGAGGVARKALQVLIMLFWTLLSYAWLYDDMSSLSVWVSCPFQALEGLKLAEKDPNGGRRLTSQGRRDLDRIAAQIKLAAAEKAKKAAAAEAVISIA